MNILRYLISYSIQRRRRKGKFLFILIVFLLIYLFIEVNRSSTDLPLIKENSSFHNEKSFRWGKENEIIEKYLSSPYNIDVPSIISEANGKYQMNIQSKDDRGRYLIYSCPFMCGGWGDRTRKIVAAFLLSLSLNRTFLIDMTWPCSIEETLTSNFIHWSISSHLQVKNDSSSIRIRSLSSNSDEELKLYDERYSVLYIETSNIAYFDLIARNEHFSQSLFNRFRIRREHIHILTLYPLFYQLLIRLRPHLQEKLDRLNLNRHSTDGIPLICGHLRIGRNPSNPKDVIFPHREKMNITVLKFLHSRPGRVFITTDSLQVQQLAEKIFSSTNEISRLIQINGSIAHIDRDIKSLACQSLEKTILDFHALSYCQLAIISKSSFGHLAIIRRMDPYRDLFLYCDGIRKISSANDYNQYKYATC